MKHILLAVTGGSPQVITETIYALAQLSSPVHINELHVVTTAFGKRQIVEKLLKEGKLRYLLEDYNLPEIQFPEEHIYVIKDQDGSDLEDILTEDHSIATADLIVDVVRRLSSETSTVLHCSIAGGRKTMSFYLGSVLQFFARPHDKLYHVLVSPEFENNPEFFFPPKRPVKIPCRSADGKTKMISTSNARVHLVEIPFLRLRSKLSLPEMPFSEMISEAQQMVDLCVSPEPLEVRLKERTLTVGDKRIYLSPMQMSFYTLFCYQKKNCPYNDKTNCNGCTDCYLQISQLLDRKTLDIIKKLNKTAGGRTDDDRWKEYETKGGMPHTVIRLHISKINTTLKSTLPFPLALFYQIESVRLYGATKYGIKLDKSLIKVIAR